MDFHASGGRLNHRVSVASSVMAYQAVSILVGYLKRI